MPPARDPGAGPLGRPVQVQNWLLCPSGHRHCAQDPGPTPGAETLRAPLCPVIEGSPAHVGGWKVG